jgi:hypothetical protein
LLDGLFQIGIRVQVLNFSPGIKIKREGLVVFEDRGPRSHFIISYPFSGQRTGLIL